MHFSHDQVRQILICAASEDAPTSLARATDVTTMDDVIRLGKEAGISPEAVRRAVLLVASGAVEPVEVRERTFGTPTWLSRRVVLGREISGKEWTRIMARLRITLDTKGQERSDGTIREWRSDPRDGGVHGPG